jgi:hypothetical protein
LFNFSYTNIDCKDEIEKFDKLFLNKDLSEKLLVEKEDIYMINPQHDIELLKN